MSAPVLAAPPTPAPNLAGSWRAGATSIDVAVESWGGDCGPRPQPSKSGGGGVVTLVQEGKELIVRGRDQDIRSDTCWSRNPSMRKQSSSFVDGVWTTRCKTAANDPREESGTYVLKVMSPDAVLYQDVSRYNWSLNTSKCVATFTTSQTLARVKDGKAAPAAAASQLKPITKPADVQTVAAPPEVVKKAEPGARACVPGAPAHLTLRPKRADIEVGQRVCFRARVTDAKDCAIENANVEWSLSHSHALRGEIEGGCFSAARTTAEAEGEFKILASALGLKADASVGVHSVDLSALIAKRMEGDAVQGFEEQAAPVVAPPPKATAKIATRTVSARQKPNQKPIWLAATGLLVLLGLGGLALAAKRKPAVGGPAISGGSDDDEPTDGDERSHTHDHGPSHPTVGSSGGSQHRPSAASAPQQRVSGGGAAPTLMAVPQMNPQPAPQPVSTRPPVQAGEPWICPLCRVGYPAEQKTCPRDGSALMPYSDFNRRIREGEQAKQKRCPKCGDMFPATSAFCGKDGASLVDV